MQDGSWLNRGGVAVPVPFPIRSEKPLQNDAASWLPLGETLSSELSTASYYLCTKPNSFLLK